MCSMAIIDQSEIDALLAEAGSLVAEASEQPAAVVEAPPPPPPRRLPPLPKDPRIRRILRVRVPVIVQLAQRMMSISKVRELSVGAIIEFEKCVEDDLDLLVNGSRIGHGACVKVGENFGLRIKEICDRRQRIRSLGGE